MRRLLCAAPMLAALLACAACSPPPPSQNLLVITVDTLRADRIGAAGYKIETPNINRLAAGGVYFTQATTSAPITLPSHTTIFTSKYPLSHGVRMNGPHVLSPQQRTLAEILKGRGMKTGAVTSAFVLHSMFGLSRGFDAYEQIDRSSGGEVLADLLAPSLTTERRGDQTTALALRWLEKTREPWFLWVHYFDPHSPYDAPEPFKSRYQRPYDAEIAYTDVQIGLLMEGLSRRKQLDKTLVVLSGDHGESLGFQGEGEHGIFLYEPTMRVPLIFHGKAAGQPRVVSTRVGLVDIAPTVLDLLGVEAPPDFQGKSLRPVWESAVPEERLIYMEAYLPYYNNHWAPLEGVVRGSWKYIFGPSPEMYNLGDDLREQNNLVSADGAKSKEMHAALVNLRRSLPKAAASTANLSPEDVQRLQSLGYLSGGSQAFEEPDAFKLASALPNPRERIPVVALAGQGRALLKEQKYTEALARIKEALAVDPGNLICLRQLAHAQGALEQREAELETLRQIGKINPEELWIYYRVLAEQRERQGDEAGRREALGRALDAIAATELKNGSLMPLDIFNRAMLHQASGNAAAAERELNEALRKHPDYVPFMFQLGNIAQQSGRLQEALNRYQQALKLEPNLRDAKINMSNTYGMMGQFARANAILEELHRQHEPTAQTLYNMALNDLQMKRLEEAEKALVRALELDGKHVGALTVLAALRLRQGDVPEARRLAGRAAEADPGDERVRALMQKLSTVP